MPVRFAPDATFPRQLVVEADVKSDRLADPAGALAAQLTALLADEADALFGQAHRHRRRQPRHRPHPRGRPHRGRRC